MAEQPGQRKARAKRWTEAEARAAIGEWRSSGLSAAAFARKRGISAMRLPYWEQRLRASAGGEVSFVNPARVPQMAGAEEVVAAIDRRDGVVYAGLVLNDRGYDRLRETGLELARTIAQKGPVAVRLTKQIVQRGQDLDLPNACQQEAYAFALTCSTGDQKEGMKAFLEKRPAKFVGR